MKFLFSYCSLFSVFVSLSLNAAPWALYNVKSGEYLFVSNGAPAASAKFNLRDPAFRWTFDKQNDGLVRILNAAAGDVFQQSWTPAHTHEFERRTFTGAGGKQLEWNGGAEWVVEPVPVEIDLKGRGAIITWTEYQAEDGDTNGRVQGPSTARNKPVSEAVGRMGVQLENAGDFVAWKVKENADGFSVRYCIPDAPAGGGIDATLSLYVNGEKRETLPLTSKYCWIYGPEYRAPRLWNDNPDNGPARKFFDTARFVLKTPVNAGDQIMLRKDAGDDADYYLIDMIELEKIPAALTKPENYLCITDFGAVANDGGDDSAALQKALDVAAEKKAAGVWIPAGIFDFADPVNHSDTTGVTGALDIRDQDSWQRFALNEIHLAGAGMWHTMLQGSGIAFRCAGNRIRVSDFAVDRQGTSRDAGILFNGEVGEDSEISNLYVTHVAVTLTIFDNTSRNLKIHGLRIRSTFAGGVVLRGGHDNPLMENIHVRGTGDDGLVFWSPSEPAHAKQTRNGIIRNCTVVSPWVANGFHLCGGENNRLENSVVIDSPCHCGIRVSTQIFITPGRPFAGTTEISGMTLIRCGSETATTYNGALQIESHGHPVTGMKISDCDIYSSPYSGVVVFTKLDGKSKIPKAVEADFTGVNIYGAALSGFHVMSRTPGNVSIRNSVIDDALLSNVFNESAEMNLTEK